MAADDDDEPTLQSDIGRGSRPQTLTGRGKHASIAPGQLLGHTYRIEALLARGGMGEVYRARHAELDTEHAIKIILPELADDTRIVDLFRREASVLRTIRHEAIVGYEGVFRDENGRLYLVMEFVDGPSLSKMLKQEPLRVPQLRQLRDRVADGLAAAHEQGVVHRDLSPDNVILPGSDLSKAKIIDFGISKLVDPAVKTIVGTDFAGKYSYVSPEQVGLFRGEVDARSDIYSLGLVLAAAALGKPLDMGNSPISVVEARRAVPDLARVPKEMRDELTAMLQPDPADRPQSMRALVPEPLRPPARTDSGRPRRPVGDIKLKTTPTPSSARGPGAAIAAIALVLVLAIGGVGYWLFVPGPPDPDPPDKIAALTKAANLALQGLGCAPLAVRVSSVGDIQVDGYVGGEADRQLLTSRLQGLPDVGRVANQTAVMQWPLCEVLDILHAETSVQPNSPHGPQIDPGGAVGTYFVGDLLKVGVTSSSIDDGYLYVDYVDGADDLVVHLLPSQFRPDNRVSKGTKIEIGSLPGENYELEEPIGTNLIIAISTPVPLFDGARPAAEKNEAARAYLADLRQRLRALAANGYQNSLFAAYSVLQLRER